MAGLQVLSDGERCQCCEDHGQGVLHVILENVMAATLVTVIPACTSIILNLSS